MDELIAYLQNFFGQYVTQMKAKANAALASMPPIEQVEAASEAGFALRQAKGCAESMLSCLCEYDTQLNSILSQAKAGTGDLASKINGIGAQLAQVKLDGMLTGGELVKKADFDAAIENARAQAVLAERQAATQAAAAAKLISGRRAEVITGGLPEALLDAATAANAELLKGDNYKELTGKLSDRIGKLKTLGIASEDVLKDFAGIGVNAEGDAEFERRYGLQQKVATDIQKTTPAPKRAPFVPGAAVDASKPMAAF